MFRYETDKFDYISEFQENRKELVLLQEKLYPINMGLKNSVQYMTQAFRIEDAELSELLLKLSVEELDNFELFSRVIKMLSGGKTSEKFMGVVTNESIVATGEPCTDLLADIALEQQSKTIFESIYLQVETPKLKEILLNTIERAEEHSIMLREVFNKNQRKKVKAEFGTTKQTRMYFGTIKSSVSEDSYDEFKKTAPSVLGGR